MGYSEEKNLCCGGGAGGVVRVVRVSPVLKKYPGQTLGVRR
jgi:hypothetical protein